MTICGDTTIEPNETFVVNFSNPSNLLLADAQATGTITTDDSSCNLQRPPVRLTTRAVNGVLEVTATATPRGDGVPNPILGFRLFEVTNASVTIEGVTTTVPRNVTLTAPSAEVTFTVDRVVAGQATTVRLFVDDSCGGWETFVGGGTAAPF